MQQRVPSVQDLRQIIESSVVKVENFVLRLSRCDNKLTAGAVIIVEEEP